jgi:hypothetical protein
MRGLHSTAASPWRKSGKRVANDADIMAVAKVIVVVVIVVVIVAVVETLTVIMVGMLVTMHP